MAVGISDVLLNPKDHRKEGSVHNHPEENILVNPVENGVERVVVYPPMVPLDLVLLVEDRMGL